MTITLNFKCVTPVGEGVGRYTSVTASRMTDAYGASTPEGCTTARSEERIGRGSTPTGVPAF